MRHKAILLPILFLLLLSSLGAQTDPLFDQSKLHDFYFTFKQSNWLSLLMATRSTHVDIKADLTFENVTYPEVGIRVKGNTSSNVSSNKKPFNLSMDSFRPDQRLHGYKTINLNNCYTDPTYTREMLTYEVFRNYIPTPATAYARVYLNNTYWGCYVMAEQINKDFLRKWFNDEDGNRYKGDPPGGARLNSATLQYSSTGINYYKTKYEIKEPTHPNAWTDLANVIDKLNNTPVANLYRKIERFLNVDRALWYIACCNIVHNMDSYLEGGHNYYMYFDPEDGRMNMLPWDANMSFAIFRASGYSNQAHVSPDHRFTYTYRPLVSKLMQVPEYKEIYYAHYRTIYKECYKWNNRLELINNRFQSLIRAAVTAEPYRLYALSGFDSNITSTFRVGYYNAPGLKPFVDSRRSYLRSLPMMNRDLPLISEVKYSPTNPLPGKNVWVTAKVTGTTPINTVLLRNSVTGRFTRPAMYDDGQHQDGAANDGVYGGSFAASTAGARHRFYVQAANTAGTISLYPPRAAHEFLSVRVAAPSPTGPMVINELLADNDNGALDEKGEPEDWIELHNRSNASVDISGWYLTDNLNLPKKWQIPTASIIPAGGFLRIWADDEPLDGKYHATFKLDKDGEEVALFMPSGTSVTMLDAILFSQQKGDRSYGRVPDGKDGLYYIYEPAGGYPLLGPGRVFIRYDGRRTGSPSDFKLTGTGTTQATQKIFLDLTGGSLSSPAVLFVSAGVGKLDLGSPLGIFALQTTSLLVLPTTTNTTGAAQIPITIPAGLKGYDLYFQALCQDLSNALVIRFE